MTIYCLWTTGFWAAAPKGTKSYRMQGIFRLSLRPALTRLGPVGPRLRGLGRGAWAGGPRPGGISRGAWAERPGPRGLGQGAWVRKPGPGSLGAWAKRPGLGGLGWEAWAGGGTDGHTDLRTDGQNIPCILQNIAPLGPLPKKRER